MLAITYALKGDEENKEKYFHLAITNGEPPENLNRAIEYYLSQKAELKETEEKYSTLVTKITSVIERNNDLYEQVIEALEEV